MNRTKKIALLSIGGAAIAAGAYFYFYKRNQTPQQRYNSLFRGFKSEIFSCNKLQLDTLQLKFDQLFNLATYDQSDNQRTCIERLQYENKEELSQYGTCSKGMNSGGYYYECFDCSPIRQELIKTNKQVEKNQLYLVLCEDCFSAPQHKNHKFLRHDAGRDCAFKCQCGEPNMMDKNCFCENHQGFEKTKGLFETHYGEQTNLWKGIERFFLDAFHLLFSIMAELEIDERGKKIKDKIIIEKKERINYFFTLIIEKIKEIIELNPPSIHFFPKLLEKTLDKPIRVGLKRVQLNPQVKFSIQHKWSLELPKKSQVNTQLSILEYIIIFYKFQNDQNDKLLSELFRSLLPVNDTFCLVFCEKFFKLVQFTIRDAPSSTGKEYLLMSQFSQLIMEYICLQRVFEHLIATLKQDILNPLAFYNVFILTKPKERDDTGQIVYLLLNICFEMLRFVNQLKILLEQYPEELMFYLTCMAQALFAMNSICFTPEKLVNSPDLIDVKVQTLFKIFEYSQLEKHVLYCYINICEGLLLINDENLTKKILGILCRDFAQGVFITKKVCDGLKFDQNNFITASITLISHLPLLVALSERKMFSKSVIQDFFRKNFTFQTEEIRRSFFASLHLIISRFIIASPKPHLLEQIDSWKQLRPEKAFVDWVNQVQKPVHNFFYSSYNRVYDFYIVTYSILLLIDDIDFKQNKLHVCSQQIQNTQSFFNEKENYSTILTCFQSQLTITQMLLDSTPFFNIFQTTYKQYFPELSSAEENETKRLFRVNIEEIIQTSVLEYDSTKMYLMDAEQMCSNVLIQTNLIKEYIYSMCKDEIEDDLNLEKKNIVFKPEFNNKFYPRHLQRLQETKLQVLIPKIINKLGEEQEGVTHSLIDFEFKNLFPYQRELYVQLLTNFDYIGAQIITIHSNPKFDLATLFVILDILLLLLKLISQIDSLEGLISEQEIESVNQIAKSFYFSKLTQFYQSEKLKNIGRQFPSYKLKIKEVVRLLCSLEGKIEYPVEQKQDIVQQQNV